jgi:hypothetical protein
MQDGTWFCLAEHISQTDCINIDVRCCRFTSAADSLSCQEKQTAWASDMLFCGHQVLLLPMTLILSVVLTGACYRLQLTQCC